MRKMKETKMNRRLKQLFSLTSILFLFFIHFGCMDPDELKPDEPPEKIEPPEPPIILLPEPDTAFRCHRSRLIQCDWSLVEGAQSHQIQIDTSSSFSYSYPQGATPPTSVRLYVYPPMTTYYLRVRSNSSSWIWHTDWSETRRFYLISTSDTFIHDTT